jgi:dimethylaniline monooxygenase (N-oxide forming)
MLSRRHLNYCLHQRVWVVFQLEKRTRFGTTVESIVPDGSHYLVNGEVFDAVIIAVGTCGKRTMPGIPGMTEFKGQLCHSSKMDTIPLSKGTAAKDIVVIGSGASAVEAVDYVLNSVEGDLKRLGEGKLNMTVVARHDKWM